MGWFLFALTACVLVSVVLRAVEIEKDRNRICVNLGKLKAELDHMANEVAAQRQMRKAAEATLADLRTRTGQARTLLGD